MKSFGSLRSTATDAARFVFGRGARFSGVYILVLIVIFFSIMRPDTFATSENARIIISAQAVAVILSLALIAPLSAEILDISIAGMMTLSVVVVGWLQAHGVNWILSIMLTLLVGLAVGLVNSLSIVRLNVPALIATLGMSSVLGAIAYWLTGGNGVTSGIDTTFARAGGNAFLSVPWPVIYMAILALVLYYVMEHMPIGRKIRATGGNREAARMTGLRVDRITTFVLLTSSTLATLAGIVYVARLRTAPLSAGDPYLLSTFAAAFLGSTQIRPGRFNVVGTILAVYLLATGVNGVQLMFPNNAWIKDMFGGLALVIAVALSVRRRRARRPQSRARDVVVAAAVNNDAATEYSATTS